MVHLLPDADGRVRTEFDTKRTGILVENLSLGDGSGNVTITPDGGGGIQIVLPPGAKLRIPDKIGLNIQGGSVGSGHRNFAVLDWKAGHAN